jgi:hypothetical protein
MGPQPSTWRQPDPLLHLFRISWFRALGVCELAHPTSLYNRTPEITLFSSTWSNGWDILFQIYGVDLLGTSEFQVLGVCALVQPTFPDIQNLKKLLGYPLVTFSRSNSRKGFFPSFRIDPIAPTPRVLSALPLCGQIPHWPWFYSTATSPELHTWPSNPLALRNILRFKISPPDTISSRNLVSKDHLSGPSRLNVETLGSNTIL